MPQSDPVELPLRIVVRQPPLGVTFAIQFGKDQLLPPIHVTTDALIFDITARLGHDASPAPRLLGPVVQGPPTGRFLYVNSGRRAGQATSCWDRRAKVPLGDLTWARIRALQAAPGSRLEATIEGTGRDGGPSCGTVPLAGEGWRLVPAAAF
ncbi:MAG: DUF5990 family protein [Myxococcales bacterium]|nr:DUF5990 family protein [Myxococcales bacterium]